MKKVIPIIFLLMAINVIASAQQYLIDSFELIGTGKQYGIYTDINSESTGLSLFIDMEAPNLNQEVQLRMPFGITSELSSTLDGFKKSLIKAKQLFVEWKKIAESNSFGIMKKKMPTKVNDQNIYFTEDEKWFSERGVDMWFSFFVNSKGQCFLLLESDYMTSNEVVAHSSSIGMSFAGLLTKNPLIGFGNSSSTTTVERFCSGSSLMFASEDEIDNFIKKIDQVIEWKYKLIENGKLLK